MKYLFILAFFLLIPQFGISQSVADQVPHYPEPNIPITNSLIVSELALKKNGVDPKFTGTGDFSPNFPLSQLFTCAISLPP